MSAKKPLPIALAIGALLAFGLAIYFYTRDESPALVTEQIEPAALAPDAEPEAEPDITPMPRDEVSVMEPEEPAFVLPRLDDSDQLVRDSVVRLTRHEGINAWLGPNELIRKTVVFIDNIAGGKVARAPARVLAPKGAFSATRVGEQAYLLDASAYARYNQVTSILLSLDTKRTVEFYIFMKPLFETAYEELGYPDKDFNEVLLHSIGKLLATPILPQPVKLIRPVVMYKFEDPNIEGLSRLQKQLIRMGPKNTAAIQTKLRALAAELKRIN